MFKSLSLKVIIFGFIFTFFSSFGQSFFLGIFNSSIRNDLSITHGQFGTIYASATLLSSFLLIWIGKKIDDINILNFSLLVIILFAEFILPVLMIFLLGLTDWRNIWIAISVLVIIFLPLASFFLVKKINLDSREPSDEDNFKEKNIKQWKRIEVLKDFRFYIICSNMLAMPWIATGVFVYQSFILTSKGWGPYIIAQSFMAYSITSVITLFLSGFLIDRYSSRNLLVYMNIPLLLSAIVLFYFKNPISSFFFLGLIGISNGLANVLGSSTWAEIYGVKHIIL